jgi:hypothetical protein
VDVQEDDVQMVREPMYKMVNKIRGRDVKMMYKWRGKRCTNFEGTAGKGMYKWEGTLDLFMQGNYLNFLTNILRELQGIC